MRARWSAGIDGHADRVAVAWFRHKLIRLLWFPDGYLRGDSPGPTPIIQGETCPVCLRSATALNSGSGNPNGFHRPPHGTGGLGYAD